MPEIRSVDLLDTVRPQVRRLARAPRGTGAAVVALAVLATVPSPGPWTALAAGALALAVGSGAGGVRRGGWTLAAVLVADVVRVAAGDTTGEMAAAQLPSALLRVGLPWLVAVAWHLRSEVLRQAAARVQEERRRRREARLQERDAERLMLAESLHDDLGHSLSLVALNLGGLELDDSLTPPVREAVTAARRELTAVVERLGESVGALRRGGAPRLAVPCDDVGDLLDRARSAGLDLRVTGLDSTCALSADDRRLVARALQEALTNSTKHAPGAPVRVALAPVGQGGFGVSVRNAVVPGRQAGGPGAGTGLGTLARAVHDAGGAMRSGQAAGEFVVEVRLSTRAAPPRGGAPRAVEGSGEPGPQHVGPGPAGTDVDTDAQAAADERADRRAHELVHRAGRRGRLIVLGAVASAVVALVAVEAVGWSQASRAHLPAPVLARIGVGDTLAEVRPLLPASELPRAEEGPDGDRCHEFAAAADPLDDASGDVHRICFAEDVVRSVTTVPAAGR